MESHIVERAKAYGQDNVVPYSHSVRAFIEGAQELTRIAQRYVAGIQSANIANESTLVPMWELVEKLEEWSKTPSVTVLTEDCPPF